ncbi:MAG: outer membrane lipoprotein carrier protein LolA [Acidimicrobiales bacterium]|nr:outer membrane lipoprotein carrier protein LolA [Hyphomonadaceae bacterium]RZV45021.1 MAG: outer membrane lipoprotein carrier protein LolA [Acidimicrobiales bacterium]
MNRFLFKSAMLTALGLALLSPAFAQQPQTSQPVALPAFTHLETAQADLDKISATLNSTQSFSGRFAQYASDGSFAQGQIYLKRPGKVRFEYDAPAPLLLISDGVTLTQIDRELETKDKVPLKSTPLAFFLAENVDLANDVEVAALQKTVDGIRVAAKDGSGEIDGMITMVFDPTDLALKEWIVSDGFGAETRVILSDLKYNQKLSPRLFIDRDNRRRDRR